MPAYGDGVLLELRGHALEEVRGIFGDVSPEEQAAVERTQGGVDLLHEIEVDLAEAFGVNVDTAESDLTKLEPAELHDRVWAGVPFQLRNDWQDLNLESDEAIVRRNTLHQFVLLAVLGLLFLETLLAFLFGRRAA